QPVVVQFRFALYALDACLFRQVKAKRQTIGGKRAVMMTQQKPESSKLTPGAKQEAASKSFDGRSSVDLIELGMRDDIDWQAEGQRVLKMLEEPMGPQLNKPTQAA
ncbi:MAG TPA: hypothetical protein DER01_09205, partial [Phycisphaerales bacterium]|nr:hypothetical protein [Phycisphaerales bacterium]